MRRTLAWGGCGARRPAPRSRFLGGLAECLPQRAEHREDLGQSRDVEDLHDPILRHHELQATHQDAQAGRVEEVDALHVHDDVLGSALDQVDEGLAEPRCRVDVDLPAERDDAGVALLGCLEVEVHGGDLGYRGRARVSDWLVEVRRGRRYPSSDLSVPTESPPAVEARPPTKRWPLIVGAAAIVVIGIGFLLFFLLRGGGGEGNVSPGTPEFSFDLASAKAIPTENRADKGAIGAVAQKSAADIRG